jgi:predicted HNH restriction endonuclease
MEESCWVCGEETEVEMHHLRHIRKINKKLSGFYTIMSKLNRKQIPVCSKCHVNIHNGLYNDKSLKDLHKTSLRK